MFTKKNKNKQGASRFFICYASVQAIFLSVPLVMKQRLASVLVTTVFIMANVRDSDTSLWLHNKLGTSNDSWTGGSICSQLNAEVLRNIKDCFPDLQTQVKLKLLLSFFHVPRRNVDEVCLL